MLGDIFSNFMNAEPQGIPRSIKDGVNAIRFATQRAVRVRCEAALSVVVTGSVDSAGPNTVSPPKTTQLRDRKSRMEVNLPRGIPLAVEAPNLDPDGDKFEKSDRELARLVVELFKPIIESTVVVFQQQRQARKAADIWCVQPLFLCH